MKKSRTPRVILKNIRDSNGTMLHKSMSERMIRKLPGVGPVFPPKEGILGTVTDTYVLFYKIHSR